MLYLWVHPVLTITKLHEFLVTQRHTDHLTGAMRHFLLRCHPARWPQIHGAVRSDLSDGPVGGAGMAIKSRPQNEVLTEDERD